MRPDGPTLQPGLVGRSSPGADVLRPGGLSDHPAGRCVGRPATWSREQPIRRTSRPTSCDVVGGETVAQDIPARNGDAA
jgi:hypothetical protein